MPGRPHHHTHGHQGLHRTSYSRCFTRYPTWCAGGRSSHGCSLRSTRQHVLHWHGGRLSHRSPPMLDSYPQPAPAQATWLNVKRRNSSTGTPASTWSHSSSRPLDDLATHQQPSRPLSTTASPNTNCEPSPRDHHGSCLTMAGTLWCPSLRAYRQSTRVHSHCVLSGPCYVSPVMGTWRVGCVPCFLAARLAVPTTLVKQPVVGPPWSIGPVANACAHPWCLQGTPTPGSHAGCQHAVPALRLHAGREHAVPRVACGAADPRGCRGASQPTVCATRLRIAGRSPATEFTVACRHTASSKSPTHSVRHLTKVYRNLSHRP